MASILKVDTIQDQDGNNIINESANTITIGASGDTITIPSGATLANSGIVTGFESTGIDDNATSTAITIDSSENVGIGTTNTQGRLLIRTNTSGFTADASLISSGQISFSNSSGGTALPTIMGRSDNNGGLQLMGATSNAPTNADLYFDIRENDNTDYATTTGYGFRFSRYGNELMRLTRDGKLGIGTSSPGQTLDVVGNAEINGNIFNNGKLNIRKDGASESEHLVITNETGGSNASPTFTDIQFNGVSGKDKARIRVQDQSNNKVGGFMRIETSGGNTTDGSSFETRIFLDNDGDIFFYEDTGTTAKFKWDATNERVGIGTTSPTEELHIENSVNPTLLIKNPTNGNDANLNISKAGSSSRGLVRFQTTGGTTWHVGSTRFTTTGFAISTNDDFNSSSEFRLTTTGLTLAGSLSKGSGSFKIDHPLPEKTNTHHLVHSFVESPQANNIYRGKVDLVSGTATVNIDTVSGMTEGTFVLLNRDIQCFTSNENGWTAVKGSVSGNTLTITAQDNTCDDTISWMVIGERQDQHMYDTDWTDDNGKVIVEPLKETEQQP